MNIVNGITSVIKEHGITDLILGLHVKKGISESFLGNLTEGILAKSNKTTLVYKPAQPLNTLKRHFIVMPENAEKEIGFPFWIFKVWNISRNTGDKLIFHGTESTLKILKELHSKHPVEAEFHVFEDWDEILALTREIKIDDNLIIVMSRKGKPSYHPKMANVPNYLNKYFKTNSFILIYPVQVGVGQMKKFDLNNPSMLEPIEKLDEIGKTIAKIFKRK